MTNPMIKIEKNDLKERLDELYLRYSGNWLNTDPVQIPHRYTAPEDIEISGFVTALFSYGKVSLFLPKVELIMDAMGKSPAKAVREKSYERHTSLKNFYYRFQKTADLLKLLTALSEILDKYGSLKNLFLHFYRSTDENILPALYDFADAIRRLLSGSGTHRVSHGLSHLVPAPGTGAMKRLNMFLRWMVRKDTVDFGIWKEISPSQLVIPVDTHIRRLAANLGLCRRKNADMKTAIEITASLKALCPDDPVKYDFALTRLGMFTCRATGTPDCFQCIFGDRCRYSGGISKH